MSELSNTCSTQGTVSYIPLSRLEWAFMNIDQVRAQLLDAAAFGKYLPPEQLENAAGKLAEGLRVYTEETQRPT